jgi:hypothetical protein
MQNRSHIIVGASPICQLSARLEHPFSVFVGKNNIERSILGRAETPLVFLDHSGDVNLVESNKGV